MFPHYRSLFLALLLLGSLSTAVIADSVRTDWTSFQFDAQNQGAVADAEPPDQPLFAWGFETGDWVWSHPVVVDGVVYLAGIDGNLYALDYYNGKELWSVATGLIALNAPAVDIDSGTIVVLGFELIAYDLANGSEKWRFDTGGNFEFASPTIVDGVVYVGTVSDFFFAIDIKSGQEIWSFQTGDYVWNALSQSYTRNPNSGGDIYSAAAITDDMILFSCWDGKVYGIDRSNGDYLRSYTIATTVPAIDTRIPFTEQNSASSPAVDLELDQFYVGSWDSRMFALTLGPDSDSIDNDGNLRIDDEFDVVWEFTTGGEVFATGSIDESNVYFGAFDSVFYAVDRSSGSESWQATQGDIIWGSAVVGDGRIYVPGVDYLLHCYDASGNELWTYRSDWFLAGSPALYGDFLYFGGFDNWLYALSVNGPKPDLVLDEAAIHMPHRQVRDQESEIYFGLENLGGIGLEQVRVRAYEHSENPSNLLLDTNITIDAKSKSVIVLDWIPDDAGEMEIIVNATPTYGSKEVQEVEIGNNRHSYLVRIYTPMGNVMAATAPYAGVAVLLIVAFAAGWVFAPADRSMNWERYRRTSPRSAETALEAQVLG